MRTFRLTERYCGNSNVTRQITNYRWSKSKGLECEMWPDIWVKSEYSLTEFLKGKNGPFIETTK